jgi:hypothetical protein
MYVKFLHSRQTLDYASRIFLFPIGARVDMFMMEDSF